MPIYEYECYNCKRVHEVMQRFNDEPLKNCPICGGELRKLVSQSSFILKGSGWYVTDYVRKNDSNNGSNGKKEDGRKSEDKSKNEQKVKI